VHVHYTILILGRESLSTELIFNLNFSVDPIVTGKRACGVSPSLMNKRVACLMLSLHIFHLQTFADLREMPPLRTGTQRLFQELQKTLSEADQVDHASLQDTFLTVARPYED
jgi:hypothetical protein